MKFNFSELDTKYLYLCTKCGNMSTNSSKDINKKCLACGEVYLEKNIFNRKEWEHKITKESEKYNIGTIVKATKKIYSTFVYAGDLGIIEEFNLDNYYFPFRVRWNGTLETENVSLLEINPFNFNEKWRQEI